MKNNLKILALLVCAQLNASSHLVKLDKTVYFAPHTLGDIDLYHHDGQFMIKHQNAFHEVKKENIKTPELRNINIAQLAALKAVGKINITQDDEKDFIIRAQIHGFGGGYALGKMFKAITLYGGYACVSVACVFSEGAREHSHILMESVQVASEAAEAVGFALPGA